MDGIALIMEVPMIPGVAHGAIPIIALDGPYHTASMEEILTVTAVLTAMEVWDWVWAMAWLIRSEAPTIITITTSGIWEWVMAPYTRRTTVAVMDTWIMEINRCMASEAPRMVW